MAKVQIRNLDKVRRQVSAKANIEINKTLRDAKLKKEIVDQVVNFWRENPVRTAADSTIENRIYLEKYNRTHPSYNLPLINITFTGQQLEDLYRGIISRPTQGIIEIKNTERVRRRYKGKSGAIGKPIKFSELYEHLASDGLDYLNLPKKITDKIAEIIRQRLLKVFKL